MLISQTLNGHLISRVENMLSGILSLWNLTTNHQKHCCAIEYIVTYFVSVLHDMAGVGFFLYNCVLFVQCLHIQVLLRHKKQQHEIYFNHSRLHFPDVFSLPSERSTC